MMQPVFSEALLARLRARDGAEEEEDRDDTFQDPNDRDDPDDAVGPRLVVTLEQPVAESYALPEPPEAAQTSGRCPDTPEGSNAPESPSVARAVAAGAPALPDLLDPAVLATMPPQVARFMLHEPRTPPPWRYRETGAEREVREQRESDGSWCG
jgi:hypothetical protein